MQKDWTKGEEKYKVKKYHSLTEKDYVKEGKNKNTRQTKVHVLIGSSR